LENWQNYNNNNNLILLKARRDIIQFINNTMNIRLNENSINYIDIYLNGSKIHNSYINHRNDMIKKQIKININKFKKIKFRNSFSLNYNFNINN